MKGEIRTKRTVNARGEFVLVSEFYLDGKKVTKAAFDAAIPDGKAGKPLRGQIKRGWPIKSMAAGVHPKQVKEAAAHAEKLGVPTEFLSTGEAVFRDRAHRRQFLKAHRMHDHSGGYGDG